MTIKGNFHVPIYECDVVITVSDNINKSFNSYLRKFDYQLHEGGFEGMVWRHDDKVGKYYVFFDTDGLSINTYNHEKSHLVEWILKDRCISAQNEVRSYLDGFISKKMNDFFKSHKLKLK